MAEQPLISRDPVAYADHFLDLMMPRGSSRWPGTITTIRALQGEVKRLRGLVDELTDPNDCWYDHHGYCQAHNLDPAPCPHQRAKDLLAERTSAAS